MKTESSDHNPSPETQPEASIQDQESDIEPQPQHPESSVGSPPRSHPEKPPTGNLQPAMADKLHKSTGPTKSTPHSALRTAHSLALRPRRRNGHIARLPKPLRDRINQMLDDGLSYPKIIKALGKDAKGLTGRCVMSWKKGGYQDYLRYQQMLDQCRARQFRVAPLLNRRNNINTFQATQQLATVQICETIVELGADILRQALAENPLNYFRMLNAFSRLTTGGLRCERHLLDHPALTHSQKARGENGKPGMSIEQMTEFRELLENL